MNLAVDITLLTLVTVNTIMHTIGCGLLIYLYRRGRRNTQQIYFISLSTAELLLNLMEALQRIPEMLLHSTLNKPVFKVVQHYSTLINLTGIWIIIYLTMVYITLDR